MSIWINGYYVMKQNKIVKALQEFYGEDAKVTLVEKSKTGGEEKLIIEILFKKKEDNLMPQVMLNDTFDLYCNGKISLIKCIGIIVDERERNINLK